MSNQLDKKIDWLAFTLKDSTVEDVLAMFEGDFVAMAHGHNGYKASFSGPEGLLVAYDGAPGMGVHVEMPARAVDRADALGTVVGLVQRVLDQGGQFTRVDVAFDDRRGTMTVADVVAEVRRGAVVGPWRKYQTISSHDRVSDLSGTTLLMGSAKSDTRCRVYDKQAEQTSKGVAVGPEPWVRYEFQFRRDRATEVARLFAKGAWSEIGGYVRSFLDFRVPSADSNKSRWAPAAWWFQLLDGAALLRISLREARSVTIDRAYAWIQRQVAPWLAVLVESAGGDLADLATLVSEGRSRYRYAHRFALATGSG